MNENLIFILHLAGEGKLDRKDLQILCLQSTHATISYGEIARTIHIPRSTVASKIKRIRTLLTPYYLKKS